MKKRISKILIYLFLTLGLILILLSIYIKESFTNVTIEQLIYSMNTAEGTSNSMIIDGAKYIIPRLTVIYLIIFTILFVFKKLINFHSSLEIKIKNKIINLSIIPLCNVIKIFLSLLFLISSIYYVYISMGFNDYFNKNLQSQIFDKYYVNPKEVKIKAPKNKPNLIYIYVESLETSLFSYKNGGMFKKTIIPNLEQIAKENLNFSNTDVLGGSYMPDGTSWTIAGMVASSAGIPLKLPIADENKYVNYGEFLPGAYTLGEVLEENGYNNYLFIGSKAYFGGRSDYFTYHGDYKIHDYDYAVKKKWISKDYYTWWGYEDKKLYAFAKKDLTEIASKEKPFNFTMLTADTHATDGYLDKSCDKPYKEQYLNTYHCTDKMLGDFIKWLQKQDFYDNTVIVITGDHLTMQGNYMEMYTVNDDVKPYYRKIFNTFINSKTKATNYHNRSFTNFDIYPTTLAALGFQIEGNKLGLGTNLFSKEKTLTENINFDTFNEELAKKSKFYNDKILGDSYQKMIENK